MTDILLSHGYFLFEDVHEQAIMKPYPPLGLLYLSSHLKAKGFAVSIYDSTFGALADFASRLEADRPSVVGLYANLMTKQSVLAMIQVAKRAGSMVVLGGPDPANYADQYLAHGADVIVIGEGELTLTELLPHLARHGLVGLDKVAGVAFLTDEGRVAVTEPRPQIDDLSGQPWPDREAIDMDRYLDVWRQHHGMSATSLITARGCPYRCQWCSHAVFGHTHRRRAVSDVVAEIAWLKDRYDPDLLWYADDVLTIHPRWFMAFHEAMEEQGLRIPFECISRADRLNESIIDALDDMGCYRLWLGSESGSQRILDNMQRQTQVEDVQKKTHLLQSRGIQVGMFIMLGYEGETLADIEATARHLKRAGPDVFLTTVAYPIKGTPYFQSVADRLESPANWAAHTDRDYRVLGRHSARFYDHATRWLVNDVNLHKARRAGSRDLPALAKMALNAWRSRVGMRLRGHEREEAGQAASGRGWMNEDRRKEGW